MKNNLTITSNVHMLLNLLTGKYENKIDYFATCKYENLNKTRI